MALEGVVGRNEEGIRSFLYRSFKGADRKGLIMKGKG